MRIHYLDPIIGYAVDPTSDGASGEYVHTSAFNFAFSCSPLSPSHSSPHVLRCLSLSRFVGEQERAETMEGVSVFEMKKVRTGEKRKREDRGDPADVEGYMGPWR